MNESDDLAECYVFCAVDILCSSLSAMGSNQFG